MTFAERLKRQRKKKGLTQVKLASAVGISTRALQNYELGTRKPGNYEIMYKLADALGTTVDDLLGVEEKAMTEEEESARDAEEIVREVKGLFAGGTLKDDDMDAVMKAVTDAYWIAKAESKKDRTEHAALEE